MTCTCLVGRSNKAARQLALATRSSCEQYKIVCERVLELPCPLLLKTVLKAELGADSVLVPLRWCYSNTSFAPCAWSRGSRKPLVRFRASLRGSWAGHGVSRAAMPSRIVEKIANKLAFFPPTPATYELAHESTGAQELFIQALSPPFMGPISGCQVLQLETQRAKKIVAAYVPTRSKRRATVLFSHGNAVDLGQMLPFCKQLVRSLDCNLLCYDYAGYGQSTGDSPTVSDTYADIDACLAWLLSNGHELHDIVLYGQSVGSGPSVNLAARTPGIAGMVLHSPLCSGMRVLNPKWQWWPQWADVFNNAALIGKVSAPVLIIHGTEDDVVEVTHGHLLHKLCQHAAEPLWAKGRGHQDVELDSAYLPHLQKFLAQLFDAR